LPRREEDLEGVREMLKNNGRWIRRVREWKSVQIWRKPEDAEQRKQCWEHPGRFHDPLDKRG